MWKRYKAAFIWKTKKRLRFLWKNKCSFLEKKKQQPVAKWFPFSLFSCIYIYFFSFSWFVSSSLCQFFFFSSSFKVNLKVHHRNWRVILLLAPMRNRAAGQKQSAPVSLRNKTTSKQFWVKTVWSILDSLRALQWFLHFSGSVKFFDKAILSGSVSHSKSIYRTTFF